MVNLLEKILWIQNQILINHWFEQSGYRHIVLNDLYNEFKDLSDTLVESILAIKDVKLNESDLYLVHNEKDNIELIKESINIINEIKASFEKQAGIINVCDEILTLFLNKLNLIVKQ